MEIVKPNIERKDVRGIFRELVRGDLWKELNILETKKNEIRGNHFHKKTRELIYIVRGKIKLTIENINTKEKKEYYFDEGSMFIMDIYEKHTIENLSDTILISLLSLPFSEEDPDMFK